MPEPLTGSERAAALTAFKGKKKPAPPDAVGHPAAREATRSSTTPDEIQAYHSQSDDALRAFRAGLDAAREGRGPKEVNLN